LDAPKPKIVSAEECAKARDELLKAEKEVTHLADRVAAQRRRLPMVQFDSSYSFEGPEGKKTLLDLFGDQSRLALYQFMDLGPGKFCPGCTHMGDNIPEHALKQLKERGIDFVFASNMPLEQIEQYKKERGWTMPFVSTNRCCWGPLSEAASEECQTVFVSRDQVHRGLRLPILHALDVHAGRCWQRLPNLQHHAARLGPHQLHTQY
jgi:predicted dithiol-disulfide oxidoreductase (DUF899 family)